MKLLAAAATVLSSASVLAQTAPLPDTAPPASATPPVLPEVTVSTPRGAASPFTVPASVDRVDAQQLRENRLGVNLSESLGVVPGLQIQNRQNYAQDLQLSVRGFGARSTFGVRGVRIYVDGIPATLPDGQGQVTNIDIGSADRVEVLRGPFSALYGNSSGGVVQVFTEDGQSPPSVGYAVAGGSDGILRQALKASGRSGNIDYVVGGSHFRTDGWRDHSAAERDIFNAKLGIELSADSRLTLVANSVRIDAQDPLGLTQAQVEANPRGAALADQYNTRKTVDQAQFGMLYEKQLAGRDALRLMVYGGERSTKQFQSIPPTAQIPATHAGGVIGLGRHYAGFDARYSGHAELAGGALDWSAGLAYDTMKESRRGWENFYGRAAAPLALGVQGTLRRNERNEVWNVDPYLQAAWHFAPRWTLEAGLRHSSVRFDSRDHYILGANRDDSGSARYSRALPVAALRFEATPWLNLYTAFGRGFETPTLNELSYRPDGQAGLNFGLRPALNDNLEVGAKARLGGGLLTAALFRTNTRDEIVTATNSGGRSTFRNAGRTRRDGFELSWTHETEGHWRTQLAYTWLDARYRDASIGLRLPGVASQAFYGSFGYAPAEGWRAGVELRAQSAVYANDSNTARAPGYAVAALQAGYLKRFDRWELNAFARVDNLFDKRYIGSVIVNEGNARYYEPAPGRNWTVGLGAAYRF